MICWRLNREEEHSNVMRSERAKHKFNRVNKRHVEANRDREGRERFELTVKRKKFCKSDNNKAKNPVPECRQIQNSMMERTISSQR